MNQIPETSENIINTMPEVVSITIKEKKKPPKEKLAQYARTYYQKRVDKDPEFLKILNERVKTNRNKRLNLDAPRKVGRPRKP
jgi:hypothetical protein